VLSRHGVVCQKMLLGSGINGKGVIQRTLSLGWTLQDLGAGHEELVIFTLCASSNWKLAAASDGWKLRGGVVVVQRTILAKFNLYTVGWLYLVLFLCLFSGLFVLEHKQPWLVGSKTGESAPQFVALAIHPISRNPNNLLHPVPIASLPKKAPYSPQTYNLTQRCNNHNVCRQHFLLPSCR
jgi:hypothetical protein